MIVPQNLGKWVNNESTQGSTNLYMLDAMNQFASQEWSSHPNAQFDLEYRAAELYQFDVHLEQLHRDSNSDITSRINYYVTQKNVNSLNIPRGAQLHGNGRFQRAFPRPDAGDG